MQHASRTEAVGGGALSKTRGSFGGVSQRGSGVPLVKKYESLATKKEYYSNVSSKLLSKSGNKSATTVKNGRPSIQKGSTTSGRPGSKSPSNAYARAFAPNTRNDAAAGVNSKSTDDLMGSSGAMQSPSQN